MNNPRQPRRWMFGICGRVAGAALSLALMLTAVLATTIAHAQMYSFPGAPNGANPWASLVRDRHGNLYGTTEGGGINSIEPASGNRMRVKPPVAPKPASRLW
jgi:hypothetical protein